MRCGRWSIQTPTDVYELVSVYNSPDYRTDRLQEHDETLWRCWAGVHCRVSCRAGRLVVRAVNSRLEPNTFECRAFGRYVISGDPHLQQRLSCFVSRRWSARQRLPLGRNTHRAYLPSTLLPYCLDTQGHIQYHRDAEQGLISFKSNSLGINDDERSEALLRLFWGGICSVDTMVTMMIFNPSNPPADMLWPTVAQHPGPGHPCADQQGEEADDLSMNSFQDCRTLYHVGEMMVWWCALRMITQEQAETSDGQDLSKLDMCPLDPRQHRDMLSRKRLDLDLGQRK